MLIRVSLFGLAPHFRTDFRTLICSRFRGGPTISERAIALDRIAGSTLLAAVAAVVFCVAAQTLPLSRLQVLNVADSAHAAASPAANLDLKRLSAEAASEPLSTREVRQLQSRLQMQGFDPGAIDGVVG